MIRGARAADLSAARDLFSAEPWRERAGDLAGILADAVAEQAGEYHALLLEEGDRPAGVVLYRLVAGAVGTGEIECVCASPAQRADAVARLLDAAVAELGRLGARIAIAEFPDVRSFEEYGAVLASRDFRVSALVPDYFADDVGLAIAVRQLSEPPPSPVRRIS